MRITTDKGFVVAKKKASSIKKPTAAPRQLFETETSAEQDQSPPGKKQGVRSSKQILARQRKAEALFEQAMETDFPRMRETLLKQALKQDPEHVDSIIEMGMLRDTPAEAIEFIRREAIPIAEQQIAEHLRHHVGQFSQFEATRSYLRANERLVRCHLIADQHEAAIEIMEEMLRLDADDVMMMREPLLKWYCNLNRIEDARQLLQQFPDDSVQLEMTRICLTFQKSGDSVELRELLQASIDENPHIVPRLLDEEEVSIYEITDHDPGGEEEADYYCQRFRSLWRATPGALTWLGTVSEDMLPAAPDISEEEIQEHLITAMEHVKEACPKSKEIWFCSIDLFAEDDQTTISREVNWDESDSETSWMISVIEIDQNNAIVMEPGGGPLCTSAVMLELCIAMYKPDDGNSRRPKTIQFIDASLCKALQNPLKSIGVAVEVTCELPEVLQFVQKHREIQIPEEQDFDSVLESPFNEDAVWEIDWRTLDAWVPDPVSGELTQPWIILVANQSDGMVLAQHLMSDQPTEEHVRYVLGKAITEPIQGESHRPGFLIVKQISHRLLLMPFADSIGSNVKVEPCQLLDQILQSLAEHSETKGHRLAAMIQQPGVTPEILGDFFEASAMYYKSRIYTRVRAEITVEISCPALHKTKWTAVTMGQMGQEIGIMLFDNPKLVKSMFNDRYEDSSETAAKMKGIGYSLDEQQTLHPADVAAAEQFGWPVPAPEAWPTAYYVDKGRPRILDCNELRFVTVAIHATLETLTSNSKLTEVKVRLRDEVFQVGVKKKSMI